ncbi:MAG: hypothetical protein GY719_20080 [bacterium]|nr:hypothetical protein [bacterium]
MKVTPKVRRRRAQLKVARALVFAISKAPNANAALKVVTDWISKRDAMVEKELKLRSDAMDEIGSIVVALVPYLPKRGEVTEDYDDILDRLKVFVEGEI